MSAQPLALPDIAPVTVRPVVLGDMPRLLALCAEHAEGVAHERLPYGGVRSGTLELVEALFDTPRRAWAWVAESGDELVGYVSATVDFSILERGYYVNLDYPFVRPAWQRHGVEPHLFKRALALAANTGCLYVQLQAPNWRANIAHLQAPSDANRVEMVRYVFPVGADESFELLMTNESQVVRQ